MKNVAEKCENFKKLNTQNHNFYLPIPLLFCHWAIALPIWCILLAKISIFSCFICATQIYRTTSVNSFILHCSFEESFAAEKFILFNNV
jgi:hypothetical protein